MNLTLKFGDKQTQKQKEYGDYPIADVSPDMSFLEMMDVLNEQLMDKGMTQLHLITIVVKEFAECVLCSLMEKRTVQTVGNDLSIAHA